MAYDESVAKIPTKSNFVASKNTKGSDSFFTILRNRKIIGSEGKPIAQSTISGWVVADFQVVLSWISSPPRNWKPFIVNKISEILDRIPLNRWRYVPTKENLAVIGSRGVSPKYLPDCRLWCEGHSFFFYHHQKRTG
ncbi:uncharacterized protein NPIL_180431 [Nephila pilipes]|uniref:Uncharacterized protein n=1 Tax=Nephila pilipes TaxID=299642 RepID=A0A8X6N356_NEPPI|nr:uncharacterized protein NPIL_180431 [Nephila pilipes]